MKYLLGKKKIVALGMALALALGTVGGVHFAESKKVAKADDADVSKVAENYTYDELLPTMEELAKEYAVYFAKNELNQEVESKTSTPIYDIKENITGYSIGLFKDNKPYGYVNIDYSKEQVVTDFALQEDTRSMYQALVDDFTNENSHIDEKDCTNKLYNPEGADYAVSALDPYEDEIFYYNAKTYENDDFEKMLENYEEHYLEYYDNIEYEDNFDYGENNNNDDSYAQIDEEYIDYNLNTQNNRKQENIKTSGSENKIKEKIKEKIREQKEKLEDYYKNAKDEIKCNFIKWVSQVAPETYSLFVSGDKFEKHGDVFIDEKDLMGDLGKPVFIDKYDPNKSLISQKTVMTTTNRYACALVGILEIVNQEDMLLDGDLKKSFDKLWDIANCEKHIEKTETCYNDYQVDCAVTFGPLHGSILKKYGKLVGKKISYSFRVNPTFATLKNHIDANHPVIFEYMIKDFTGHGVNVFGYREGKMGYINTKYLIVANGWYDDAPRYILYNPDSFVVPSCTAYTIKDKK